MRTIRKGTEPKSLTQYRASGGKDYEGYREKDDLRKSLVREQRGICCYCMARICANASRMKIAHWQPRSKYAEAQLEYTNLLGACHGNDGRRGQEKHCDTSQGDRTISRNPANLTSPVEKLLKYRRDGEISSTDSRFNDEINNVLNLNLKILMNNRKKVLDTFLEGLAKFGSLQQASIQRMLDDWNGDSHSDNLRPYCQIVVFWLRKRQRGTLIRQGSAPP